jgi:preprotein translocase subunit SecD
LRRISYPKLIFTLAVFAISISSLLVEQISIPIGGTDFERGSQDTVVGLQLGLDLQGGSHLVYQAKRTSPTQRQVDAAFDELDETSEIVLNQGKALERVGADGMLLLAWQEDVDSVLAVLDESEDRELILTVQLALGTTLIYEVLASTGSRSVITEYVGQVRTTLEETGYQDFLVTPLGTRNILINIPEQDGLVTPRDALNAIGGMQLNDALIPLWAEGGLFYWEAQGDQPTEDQIEGVISTIRRRVDAFGVTEPVIQLLGTDRILIQLPGISDLEQAKNLIGRTARLDFKERECVAQPCNIVGNYIDKGTGLTGDALQRSYASQNPTTGAPVVSFEFKSDPARIFAELTTRLAKTNDAIAIFLDGEELIAPVVRQSILTGSGFIEGSQLSPFSPDEARTLAIQLESGILPVSIDLIQERDVDAILGKESLENSLVAGLIGLGLVFLFMALTYRLAGIVGCLALTWYIIVVIAIFKLIPVTLTLSGVAAFILSIGLAVDANILVFERTKEELRSGRTLMSAVQVGFNRAWSAIRDGNVSTMITCAILFWFGQRLGTSVIQGFALTLFIGVAVSMVSATVVTRTLLLITVISPLGKLKGMFTPEGFHLTGKVAPTDSVKQGETL